VSTLENKGKCVGVKSPKKLPKGQRPAVSIEDFSHVSIRQRGNHKRSRGPVVGLNYTIKSKKKNACPCV